MKETAVTFIGHSACMSLNKGVLKKHIEDLILDGKTFFLCGGMGEYDRLCAHMVYNLKKQYSHIKLFLVIPYLTFKKHDFDMYDEVIYPEGVEGYYFKRAIVERNKFLVDNSSVAICFVDHTWGGAAKTYEYAKKKEIRIINLSELE